MPLKLTTLVIKNEDTKDIRLVTFISIMCETHLNPSLQGTLNLLIQTGTSKRSNLCKLGFSRVRNVFIPMVVLKLIVPFAFV